MLTAKHIEYLTNSEVKNVMLRTSNGLGKYLLADVLSFNDHAIVIDVMKYSYDDAIDTLIMVEKAVSYTKQDTIIVNLFSCSPINASVVDVLAKLREMIVCRKPHSIIRNIFILANSLQYEVSPGLMSRLTILDITNENRSKSQLLRS